MQIRSQMAKTRSSSGTSEADQSRVGTAVALARELYMSGQGDALEAVLSSTNLCR